MSRQSESITWIPVADELPDSDQTVLLNMPGDDEPVWLGWWSGEEWYFVDATLADDCEGTPRVTAWAHMPAGLATTKFCAWDDCDGDPAPGSDLCAGHIIDIAEEEERQKALRKGTS